MFVSGEGKDPRIAGEEQLQVGDVNKALSDHAPIVVTLPMSSKGPINGAAEHRRW